MVHSCNSGKKFKLYVSCAMPFIAIIRRPFIKRFALCYRTVALSVLSACLSVTLVYCCQTVEWIKMKLVVELGLGPGHIVLDKDPALQKGPGPQFSAHVCCGQTAAWIKMPLDIGTQLPPPQKKRVGHSSPLPLFGPCIVAKRLDDMPLRILCPCMALYALTKSSNSIT